MVLLCKRGQKQSYFDRKGTNNFSKSRRFLDKNMLETFGNPSFLHTFPSSSVQFLAEQGTGQCPKGTTFLIRSALPLGLSKNRVRA